MNKKNTILEIRDLNLNLEGREMLRDFSLRLSPGEKTLLRGPSGCGKSTILRLVLGLTSLPKNALRGEIVVFGERLSRSSIWSIRKKSAYVPQHPDFGSGSISDFLESVFSYQATLTNKPRRDEIENLIKRLSLPADLLRKESSKLSGGERMKVSILTASLLKRELWLVDEPLAGLDAESKSEVCRILDETKGSMLLVSHDRELDSVAGSFIDLQPKISAS